MLKHGYRQEILLGIFATHATDRHHAEQFYQELPSGSFQSYWPSTPHVIWDRCFIRKANIGERATKTQALARGRGHTSKGKNGADLGTQSWNQTGFLLRALLLSVSVLPFFAFLGSSFITIKMGERWSLTFNNKYLMRNFSSGFQWFAVQRWPRNFFLIFTNTRLFV